MANRHIIGVQMPAYDLHTLSGNHNLHQSPIQLIRLEVSEMKKYSTYIDIWTCDTLKELKEKIAICLRIATPIHKFYLEIYDKIRSQWLKIDDSNPSAMLKQLGLCFDSTINVEYYNQQVSTEQRPLNSASTSNNNREELVLKLCVKPLDRTDYTFLKIHPSSTLGQLRKRAYEYLDEVYKDRPIFVWNKDQWVKFDSELDSQTLSDLSFESYTFISTDYDDYYSNSKTPNGLCGLANLGNTCFMNSVFQCLSNIPEFKKKILAFNDELNAPIIGGYGKLMKQMWSRKYNYIEPSTLLNNINDSISHYSNYRQHDAQEFMNHFLHLIHAELSTNDSSLITELFYGKIRSTVKCLGCQRTERTIESISFLPLPISKFNQKTILYIKSDGEQRLVSLQINSSVRDIMDLIDCFIDQHERTFARDNIQAIRLVNNRVEELYKTWKDLIDIRDNELAFIECPKKCLKEDYIWCNYLDRSTGKAFRSPSILIGSTYECSYAQLSDQIDQLLGHLFSMTGAPPSAYSLYWEDRYDRQYKLKGTANLDENLRYLKSVVIKMDTEWADTYKTLYDTDRSTDDSGLLSLLADFFREEPLDGDYHCLKCPKLTKARQKSDLCLPLPPVLIIQLKRFTYDSYSKDKIDTFISFPIDELDLNTYIIKDDTNKNENNSSTKYELVAVSNHTGSLTSGHYTTYAKNIDDEKWYSFDDKYLSKLNHTNDIVTKNAYILVYVQKSKDKR